MPQESTSIEHQLEWLADEVLLIKEGLINLVGRVGSLEQGVVLDGNNEELSLSDVPIPKVKASSTITLPIEDDSWTHLSQEVLLPRLAAVSFMMVVALILRTVTANGMLTQVFGSSIGVFYASSLIGVGFYLYMKKNKFAPVFPACGVLLLYSIIYEAHAYFSSLDIHDIYLILLVSEVIIVLIGLKCQANVLLYIAVFFSSAVAIALDFTSPVYELITPIVFINVVAGHLAARFSITNKLRWYTLIFSLVVWMLWAFKLNFYLGQSPEKAVPLGVLMYLPILFLFWGFYIYTSLWKTLKKADEFEIFHSFLPAVVCGATFFAANAVLKPWVGQQRLIGFVTVLISACFIALVAWLAKRQDNDVPGGKEYVTAATILLIQGLAISFPPLFALPVWVVAASVLTVRSSQWRSGGIRVISYLFQMFILVFALKTNTFSAGHETWWAGTIVAGLLSVMTLCVFSWCRKNPPDYESVYFGLFDKKDHTAVVLLVIGLFEAYVSARFVAGHIAATFPDPLNALYCSQSIILNSGIVILLLVGLKMMNKEILTVAALVVLIAAIKVFLFDLLQTDGLPLVLSVFSFGVVAATSSVVMRKWAVRSKKAFVPLAE